MVDYILMAIVCFTCTVFLGKYAIPFLTKLKCGQTVREDGPKSHVKKNGTPTMGGIIFIIPVAICSLIFLTEINMKSVYPIIAMLLFAIVGGLDDFLKIKRGKNLGLTAKQKMILLSAFSIFLAYISFKMYGSVIDIPFLGLTMDLGTLYIPFIVVVFIGATNAVNLTDGLDGLATSVSIVVAAIVAILSLKMGIITIAESCILMISSLTGFLIFNINPAKVFMGDTGSLAIGGFLTACFVSISNPILFILVGIIYVIETMSVIMQVCYFKSTGKRLFKMSPIHHHFEMSGWSENKIVAIFTAITMIFGILVLYLA